MRERIERHPNLATWLALAVGMLLVLAWSARDVALAPTQWLWLAVATVLLAGLCAWIISWEADTPDEWGDEASDEVPDDGADEVPIEVSADGADQGGSAASEAGSAAADASIKADHGASAADDPGSAVDNAGSAVDDAGSAANDRRSAAAAPDA